MSFGFSPSDIFALVNVARKTYRGWKSACGEYADITTALDSLLILLERIEDEAEKPKSAIVRSKRDADDLGDILNACGKTVRELNAILTKFRSLGVGKSREKNWDRIRFGNKNLDSLKSKLQLHETALSAYLNTVGLSSLARIEGKTNALSDRIQKAVEALTMEIRTGSVASRLEQSLTLLPERIQKTVDDLAKEINSGRREGSIMTTYHDDEKEPRIKLYLKVLAEKGLFEEAELAEEDLHEMMDPAFSSAGGNARTETRALLASDLPRGTPASHDAPGKHTDLNEEFSQISASPKTEKLNSTNMKAATYPEERAEVGWDPDVHSGSEVKTYGFEDGSELVQGTRLAPTIISLAAPAASGSRTSMTASHFGASGPPAPGGHIPECKDKSKVDANFPSVAVHMETDKSATDSAVSKLEFTPQSHQVEERVECGDSPEAPGSVHEAALPEGLTVLLATDSGHRSQEISQSPGVSDVDAAGSDDFETVVSEAADEANTNEPELVGTAEAWPADGFFDGTFVTQKPSKKARPHAPQKAVPGQPDAISGYVAPYCETDSEGDGQYRPHRAQTPLQSQDDALPEHPCEEGPMEPATKSIPTKTRNPKRHVTQAAIEESGYAFGHRDGAKDSYFVIHAALSHEQIDDLVSLSRLNPESPGLGNNHKAEVHEMVRGGEKPKKREVQEGSCCRVLVDGVRLKRMNGAGNIIMSSMV